MSPVLSLYCFGSQLNTPPPRLFVLNVENAFCIVVNGTFMLLIVGVVGEYQSLLRFLDRGE